MSIDYVHGYSAKERTRLTDQASTLTSLLHADTRYRPGSLVLEAGCGVGAQTVILAANSPGAIFTAVDISAGSLAEAQRRARDAGLSNVTFGRADIFGLPFGAAHFDHVFVCFVLEHLTDPAGALAALQRVLKPGGSITVIEGDHGSAYFHPEREALRPLLAGSAARFRVRDWANDPLGQGLGRWAEIAPADVVIVEGVTASRRAIAGDLVMALWVEVPAADRLRRGIARDGEQRRPLWIEWMALEEEFFSRDGAPGRADYIVSGKPHRAHDPASEVVLLER